MAKVSSNPPGRLRLRILYVLIPVCWLLLAAWPEQNLTLSNELKSAVALAVEQDEPERPLIQRLIPDQYAMLGAPNTSVDLGAIFADTAIGQNGEPIKPEILRAKKMSQSRRWKEPS